MTLLTPPSGRSLLRVLASVPVVIPLALMGACQSAPAHSIPDPLPETLEWALPDVDSTAFLGLEVRENDSGSLEELSFDPGVRVHSVIEHSPAMEAGVRVDDVLLTYDGTSVATPSDLAALLDSAAASDQVTLGIQRGDTVFDVAVTLKGGGITTDSSAEEAFVLDPARTRGAWGTDDGAVLVARAEDGPVGRWPLGTRVIAVEGQRILSGRGLVRRLISRPPGDVVELRVEAPGSGKSSNVEITLQDEGRRLTRLSVPVLATYDAAADRTRESFVLLDFYFISLFRYQRNGSEKSWRFLRFFEWSSGVGALDE